MYSSLIVKFYLTISESNYYFLFFAFQWSPNLSSILASGCLDGKALLWDVRKARNCLMSFDMGNIQGKEKKRSLEKSMAHKGSLNGLTFSNTSRHLVTYGCCDGRVRKWDIM